MNRTDRKEIIKYIRFLIASLFMLAGVVLMPFEFIDPENRFVYLIASLVLIAVSALSIGPLPQNKNLFFVLTLVLGTVSFLVVLIAQIVVGGLPTVLVIGIPVYWLIAAILIRYRSYWPQDERRLGVQEVKLFYNQILKKPKVPFSRLYREEEEIYKQKKITKR